MEWNKSMNEKIYCRIRRVRAVLLTFFLTAAVVLIDAQSIREKEYEKTEIIYCIGDSITYGSGQNLPPHVYLELLSIYFL